MSGGVNRRQLFAAVGAGLAGLGTAAGGSPAQAPGVVGLADLEADLADDAKAARRAVAAAIRAATGSESARYGLRKLVRADDVVGVKLNCLAAPRLSPRPSLVEALVELLVEAGVGRHNVILFERSSRELARAGFVAGSGAGARVVGTDRDWDPRPSESGAIGSCFARLVSTTCTALVSFGVVKDHDLAGVSAGMKNFYGVIHNPNKYHDSGCDPYVADVVNHPFVRSKLRLTMLDGTLGQCHGGPAFAAGWTFPLATVAASTDPVAADLWAWQVIDAERVRRGLPTLAAAGREPRWLATAERYGLGLADPERLERRRA